MFAIAACAVRAQPQVEVTGIGSSRIPVAVLPFRGEQALSPLLSRVIRDDLERSGAFAVAATGLPSFDESARPDLGPFRAAGVDGVAAGSVVSAQAGHHEVRYRLWDSVAAKDLGGRAYPVSASELRLAAHRIADDIHMKLTGTRGAFSTRLAYVTKAANRYTLWVSDADGERAVPAFSSTASIISPSFSPDGTRLAYVSFESRKPVVYVQDVATGRRRLIANFRGSNSAPAWAPDGKSLAVTLTRDNNSQLYTIPAEGGQPRRLTQSAGIDTEPAFSPDGRFIYFTSDRSGAPQVYRMPAEGGEPQRVTFIGSYNISPAPSPDGRQLAYISRVDGSFRLHVMDLATGEARAVTDGTADERPSFAPNGRLIVFATRIGAEEALMTTTADGRTRTRLKGLPGDIREPNWGPFAP